MTYKDARNSLRVMIDELEEAGVKMRCLLDYCTDMDKDKKSTFFEVVRDAYDDYFAVELAAEEKSDREESDYADYKYEMMRDKEMGL